MRRLRDLLIYSARMWGWTANGLAVCTGPPYVMAHPDWSYVPGDALSEEDGYYHRRVRACWAPMGHWAAGWTTTLGADWLIERDGVLRVRT